MRVSKPLFPVDAGWPYLVAGLVVIMAVVLVPPQIQLHGMRAKLAVLRDEEATAINRLRAYSEFMETMDAGDEVLTRRIVAAQYNLVRAGDTPVLIAPSTTAPVTEWIEATVTPVHTPIAPYPNSQLSEMVTGPHRHWVLAGASVCLFMGLIIGAPTAPRRARWPGAWWMRRHESRSLPEDIAESIHHGPPCASADFPLATAGSDTEDEPCLDAIEAADYLAPADAAGSDAPAWCAPSATAVFDSTSSLDLRDADEPIRQDVSHALVHEDDKRATPAEPPRRAGVAAMSISASVADPPLEALALPAHDAATSPPTAGGSGDMPVSPASPTALAVVDASPHMATSTAAARRVKPRRIVIRAHGTRDMHG